jgi:hypothetical protein
MRPILKITHHKKGLAEWLKQEHLPSKHEAVPPKREREKEINQYRKIALTITKESGRVN